MAGPTPMLLFVGRELPAWPLFWLDDAGQPRDFSGDDYVWAVTLSQPGRDPVVLDGTVTENPNPTTDRRQSTDVPSLTFLAGAGELDDVGVGEATVKIVGVSAAQGGRDVEGQWSAVFST